MFARGSVERIAVTSLFRALRGKMSQDGERMHRPDPAREQPIRDFPHYARNHGMGARPAAPDDPIARGVKLGYSVLDEQMREGQRLAERLRGGARPGAAPLDIGALVERALNIYRDIGALAFAATEALARNPTFGAGRTAEPAPAASPASSTASASFALDVRSARRVTVKLNLRPGVRAPRVGSLTAANGGASAISTVGLDLDEGGAATLRLEIADDQPGGDYHAVVLDAEGEVAGTLTVRIPG